MTTIGNYKQGHLEYINREFKLDGESVLIDVAMAVSGLTSSELTNLLFPSRKEVGDMPGHYHLRMYYGEPTGIFYRGDIRHEYRIGYEWIGDHHSKMWTPVVSTCGGFDIMRLLDEHGSPLMFDSFVSAMKYLTANYKRLDEYWICWEHDNFD